MAFGDKPGGRPPFAVKSNSGTFEANYRKAAAVFKANGYRTEPLPVRKLTEIVVTEHPAIRWAVPGFVPEGLTILGGPKSRGKSFIVLDWAIAVAAGSVALGNVGCEPGAVLYLALEDSERRIKERSLAIRQGGRIPELLEVATTWRSVDDGGIGDIDGWIQSRENPRLVIVDVLAKIKGIQDQRKGIYDQDYAHMAPFHQLAKDHNLAMLLVHHTNKTGADDPVMRISGTMGLTGACDTTLVLERAANDPNGTLHVRGRDVAEREVALQFDRDTGCVTLLGPATDFRKSEERRQIIKLLYDSGETMTPTEIASAISGKYANVKVLLAKMAKSGEISRLANGKYYVIRTV